MAEIDFRHLEAVGRHPTPQKRLASNLFDLQLSLVTKTSSLSTKVFAVLAAKVQRKKRNFSRKNRSKFLVLLRIQYFVLIIVLPSLRTNLFLSD